MVSCNTKYLHGYNQKEQERLYQQAHYLEHQIFREIDYSQNKNLLEVGSGVGAQTEILLRRFPGISITGVDFSEDQIETARKHLSKQPFAKNRVKLLQMDAMDMDFPDENKFDCAFLCWILEHVPEPSKVLSEVRRVLQPGSKVVVTEVLNSTFFVEPYSPGVLHYWMRFNDLQYDMGGDPFVGGKLGNLLQALGYKDIHLRYKILHLDNRQPALRAKIISYWTDLLLSGQEQLLEKGYITLEEGNKMVAEMKVVAKNPQAVFYYSFIQAEATT